ncbi:helix-turn-helix transcriptional regulator [Haloarchaeobius amylolyticus]|uniref:Helix-turn-helix transcriptional regulator n=1 Tax=Haloarchaeobius amylolyticus TaxID=1198296 RepID=A0ABD6BAH8_9EURY
MVDRRGEAIGTLEFVARSPSRVLILETLAEEGVASRESLAAEVEVVRTTLQRSLRGLADRGLIRERGRQYELTSAGALVTRGLSAALERVSSANRLEPVLKRISAEEFTFDIDRLADATVVESTTANPYAPVDRHAASLADATHARLLLPAAGAKPLETTQQAIDAGATFELVVTTSVAETLRTSSPIADVFAPIAADDSVSVSVVTDEIEWYLGIVDDTVQIGVHDERGVPAALLESADDRVREWAIDRFDAFQRRASAFERDQ